ncbi:serine hydrolase domain-containing protein [Saccharopolyspora cebuensis]|uniref:Serine hydrolase domain-containing protein n=1 Tax=Saccharopolyspora cebuensis TaxID=418759 RepID=A0ABV4CMK8_9PSEU
MTRGGFSAKRLTRVRDVLERRVDSGHAPGAVGVVARHGEVHVVATGTLAFEGAGSRMPMAADTICRIASMTKSIVAACAMTLVEDCTLRLDDPVDEFLPELSDMTVLVDPNGPLDDTVPAKRSITLWDLLTCRLGTGTVLAEPGTIPIVDALDAIDRGDHPDDPGPSPDEWIRRLGELPLVCQPGERWMYHHGPTAIGVLLTRATGMPLEEVLRERICEPLGMSDTALSVGNNSMSRLATTYEHNEATGELIVEYGPGGPATPAFKEPASGLVSTADDLLSFTSALRAGGTHRGKRVLSRPSVTLMTCDHLSPTQKAASRWMWPLDYYADFGWGFGMEVRTRRTNLGPSVGSYGWYGKYGTAWCNDPAEDMTTIFMYQRSEGLELPTLVDFWTAAYQAIDD